VITDQALAAPAGHAVGRSGDGEDLAILFHGVRRGRARPSTWGRSRDGRTEKSPGNDPVGLGEPIRRTSGAGDRCDWPSKLSPSEVSDPSSRSFAGTSPGGGGFSTVSFSRHEPAARTSSAVRSTSSANWARSSAVRSASVAAASDSWARDGRPRRTASSARYSMAFARSSHGAPG
jgi:hypothetical protein